MTDFQVGDSIRWKIRINAKVKQGVVVAVVPAGKLVFPREYDYSVVPTARHHRAFGFGVSRDEKSYIVSVKTGKTDKAKRTLYHAYADVRRVPVFKRMA